VARTTNTRRPQRPKAGKFGLVFDSNVGKHYRKIKRDDNNSARPQRSPHYTEYFALRGRRIRDDAATWGCHEFLDEVESCSVQPSTQRVPQRYSTKTPPRWSTRRCRSIGATNCQSRLGSPSCDAVGSAMPS
jgi:hypothetical protein